MNRNSFGVIVLGNTRPWFGLICASNASTKFSFVIEPGIVLFFERLYEAPLQCLQHSAAQSCTQHAAPLRIKTINAPVVLGVALRAVSNTQIYFTKLLNHY